MFCFLQLYDLANPGFTRNSQAGCPQTEDMCMQMVGHRCSEQHGSCVGSMVEPRCECNPGWSGVDCLTPTIPTTFRPQSYVKYALSFDADKFMTKIQLRFRTREEHGELFRVSDQHNREYAILEVNIRGVCKYTCTYIFSDNNNNNNKLYSREMIAPDRSKTANCISVTT